MIKFFKNNRILFIVVVIVIIGGVCLAAVLIGNTKSAMKQEGIKTAVAEASESAAKASESASPTVIQLSEDSNAKMIGDLIDEREGRRDYVIPSVDNTVTNEAKTWKRVNTDNFKELQGKAVEKTAALAKEFFGCGITETDIQFLYYTDTSKDRKDIVKVATSDDAIVCTLAADTLDLIEIDYYFIPDNHQSLHDEDTAQNKNKEKTPDDNDKRIADMIAASYGTKVTKIDALGYGGFGDEIEFEAYNVTLANGKFIRFGTLNGKLYAIGVYPSKICMDESVYFEADIQHDSSVVKLVSPQNFKEGQPGKGDMTQDEAKKMYLLFLNLANGTGNYPDPSKMTFYIDYSGARENYWHIKGDILTMDLTSSSKKIISLTCNNLWNPEHDLTDLDKIVMGGKEYTDYIDNIMGTIYGGSLFYVGLAGADDSNNCCTVDADMTDGSINEFSFKDGKLQEIYYFANEDCFRYYLIGWKADHVYINSITGKEFTPQN